MPCCACPRGNAKAITVTRVQCSVRYSVRYSVQCIAKDSVVQIGKDGVKRWHAWNVWPGKAEPCRWCVAGQTQHFQTTDGSAEAEEAIAKAIARTVRCGSQGRRASAEAEEAIAKAIATTGRCGSQG